MNSTIALKMENIKVIFQGAQENASKLQDISDLIKQLETTEKEFLSVAYEGAAMELALMDLSKGDSISVWRTFLDASEKHSPQVYIGMGWAVAKEKYDTS